VYRMDQMLSGEQDLEVDIEAGRSDVTQESTSDTVSGNGVWSERANFGVSEKIADDLSYPLIRDENRVETSSQSLDLSEKKCGNGKFKKSRKASKPPRPPKGPSLSENDRKIMRDIQELAMRKRARIERMKKSLKRLKAAKTSPSSPCITIFSMIITAIFFAFLVFQGTFLLIPFSTLNENQKMLLWSSYEFVSEERFYIVLDSLLLRYSDIT